MRKSYYLGMYTMLVALCGFALASCGSDDDPVFPPATSSASQENGSSGGQGSSGDSPSVDARAVDLGLSVKWAKMNIGATAPHEKGDYFAWGETTTKSVFGWQNYKYGHDSDQLTKYVLSPGYGIVDNKYRLDISDDAAAANWGGKWRVPNADEMLALYCFCYWEWTDAYDGNPGVAGYIVYKLKADADQGKRTFKNKGTCYSTGESTTLTATYTLADNHIFLPYAGYSSSEDETYSVLKTDEFSVYWLDEVCEYRPYCSPAYSYSFLFTPDLLVLNKVTHRYVGAPIRAVLAE